MNQAYLPMNCKTVINLSSKGDIATEKRGKNSFIIDSLDIKSLENAVMKLAPIRIKNSRVILLSSIHYY